MAMLGVAGAQTKSPASEAFSACRDQEKVGDARACWKVWLGKYRAAGSEAEVAYAEEHAAQAVSPPPAPPPPPAPSASTSPPPQVPPPPPGIPQPPVAVSEPSAAEIPGSATGPILDLCAPAAVGKESFLLLAPANADVISDDATIRAIDGGGIVRDVFVAKFPSSRFDNVVTRTPASLSMVNASVLTLDDIRAHLSQPRPAGDAKRQARADRERDFALYSLPCATYLALPAITAHTVTHEVARPDRAPGSPLNLLVEGTIAVFRREGSSFRRIGAVSASAPTAADLASDSAVSSATSSPDPRLTGVDLVSVAATELPAYLSAVPEPQCLLGRVGQPGVAGLQRCGARGEGTMDQALAGVDERVGPICRAAARSGDPSNLIRCEVRARAAQLGRALQRATRELPPLRLYGQLSVDPAGDTTWLGRSDGVKVGQGFEVRDEVGDRVAYLKVTRVGTGGESSPDPTTLALRSGDAPSGSWISRYPQTGVSFSPYFSVIGLILQSGTTSYKLAGQTASRGPATIAFGGGASVGFDLSSLVGWNETTLRLAGGVFTGFAGGDGATTILVPIDLWLEKGFYLRRRLSVYGAIGATYEHVSLDIFSLKPFFSQDASFTSELFGPAARAGISYLLHPDWTLALEAVSRFPLNAASYDPAAFGKVPSQYQIVASSFSQRTDHYATLGGSLNLAWTF